MYTNIELLTKELKKVGFSKYKISKMVSSGELIRLSKGHYFVNSYKDLKDIGEKYLELGEEELGYEALNVYFSYEPTDGALAYKLFNLAYKYDDFDSIADYYCTIHGKNSTIRKEDKRLMLYILSKTISLPDNFAKMARKLTLKDVSLKDNFNDNIRRLILSDDFEKAISAMNYKRSVSDFDRLIKRMLDVSLLRKEERKQYWLDLVNNRQYDVIHDILTDNLENSSINSFMQNVLRIVDDILELRKTKKIPTASTVNTEDLQELIELKNYAEALEVCKKKYSKSGPLSENLVYLLLVDINDRIRRMKQQENLSKVIKEKLKNPYNVYSNEKSLEVKSRDLLNLFMPGLNEKGLTIISARSETVRSGLAKLIVKEPDLICFPIFRDETPALVIQKVYPKEELAKMDVRDIMKKTSVLTSIGINEFENKDYKRSIKALKKVLLYGKAEPKVYYYIGCSISRLHGLNNMYLIADQVNDVINPSSLFSKQVKFTSDKVESSDASVDASKVMKKTFNES